MGICTWEHCAAPDRFSLTCNTYPATSDKGSPYFISGPGGNGAGGHSLAAVDDDVLGHDPSLQHAHLGVVATATEKPRWFDLEVGNPLSVVIHNAEAIFF